MTKTLKLIDNPTLKGREANFIIIDIDSDKIIKSWKLSLFSFEWLTPEGKVKDEKSLEADKAEKFKQVQAAYNDNQSLERPILGLGIMDNVEIGSRKEVLLTLYSLGIKNLSVHIPKNCLNDFKKYM